jgi:hypothetical protein
MTDTPYDGITTVPDVVALTTLHDFDRWRGATHGCIVIKDVTSETPVVHHRECPFVDRTHFADKVLKHGGANGRYWWAKNSRIAEQLGARRCRHPADPFSQ